MGQVRLQKYLADCGVASRRKSEEIIRSGKVKVNNEIVTELGTKITPGKDEVSVNDKKIISNNKKVYIMLNKPEGYITTSKEQFNRPSVMDLIQDVEERVFSVGRLDMDTSGLLILTNDGDFAFSITHPKHHIPKTYTAKLFGVPDSSDFDKVKKGIKIEDYTTAPARMRLISSDKKTSVVEIVISEGKNRQIRKMCKELGHPVISLRRIAIGSLELGDLPIGKWRHVSKKELNSFLR